MILSNSPFLEFQKTNRIFKEFYLSHAKTTVSLPIVVSIVGKTKMSRTFLSIEFKSFKREIKVVESCFLLEAICPLSFQKSIFRYLQPTKEIDQTFHLPWGFEDFVDRKILVGTLSRNDDDRVSCANKIHDYSVPMISNVINSQRLWIIG